MLTSPLADRIDEWAYMVRHRVRPWKQEAGRIWDRFRRVDAELALHTRRLDDLDRRLGQAVAAVQTEATVRRTQDDELISQIWGDR